MATAMSPTTIGRIACAIAGLLFSFGCSQDRGFERTIDLTESDRALMTRIAFPDTVMGLAKRVGSLGTWVALDEGGMEYEARGLVISVDEKRAEPALDFLAQHLPGLGYDAFYLERNFGFEPDRIAVLATVDQWSYLEIVRTDGINYDVTHQDVVARLREWDARYGLEIIGGNFDWVEAKLERMPDDLLAFAREVYAFCPDVVDQGVESVAALADEIRRTSRVFLWWD